MNLARSVRGQVFVDIPIRVRPVRRWWQRHPVTLEFEGEPGKITNVTLRPGDSLTLQHTMDVANRPRLFREPS
jgi:hypothetical protein